MSPSFRLFRVLVGSVFGLVASPALLVSGEPATPPSRTVASAGLKALSLEDLMQLDVSTLSRKTEPWWSAPGAIDMVTGDDLQRSGAIDLPEALRLLSGVHVGHPNTQSWAIATRGFNITAGNKMNVQLDGRSLYTPFYSGVPWALYDTLLEDVDRIEVVRGAAGALWGDFAMNGFIQIETKPAWDTQGTLIMGAVGTEMPGTFAVRHGGEAGKDTFYRAYFKYTQTESTYNAAGDRPRPPTDVARAGFRTDTRTDPDSVLTVQGDVFTNRGLPRDNRLYERFSGASLSARWRRALAVDSDLQVNAGYDYAWHLWGGGFLERRQTVWAGSKYRKVVGAHDLQTGFDGMVSPDKISSPGITIDPPSRTFFTGSLFLQDTVALVPDRWSLTAAGQLQWSAFSDLEFQPTLRLAHTPSSNTTWWAAVSRAVRTPVRIDADLLLRLPDGTRIFEGNDHLESEKVLSFELGLRRRMSEQFAADLALFANDYDDVRSYESETPVFRAFPWTFKNTLNARSLGAELTLLYQPTARVFIKAAYRYLDLQFTKDPGSGDFQNALFEANDPRHLVSLSVRTDVADHWRVDVTLRGTSGLPRPIMPGYLTADATVTWSPNAEWEVALVGQDLLDRLHPEYVASNSANEQVARRVYLKATWRF